MRFRNWAGGAAALVLTIGMAAPAPAAAALFATFSGKVTYAVTDLTFGSYDLIGLDYTATYEFDPSVGTTSIYSPGGGVFDYIRAGADAASPIRSLTITINGHQDVMDFQADQVFNGRIERVSYPASPSGQLHMSGVGGSYVPSPVGGQAYDYHTASSGFASPTLIAFDMAEPWSPVGGSGLSSFLRQVQNAGRGYDQAYDIKGSVTSVRVFESAAPTGAVPEPGTWALMIGGFGLAGSMIRRHRTRPA
ncbi:PEPxxWA-CTERM sorting domain-containing protein [Phenylobacterium sp.]|uniref:PEPxxWA-CTERM sorting domain-containing protein n=1 Tax=Phenylobacterium sp. TaxID=1871053 RepID=UPI00301D2F30